MTKLHISSLLHPSTSVLKYKDEQPESFNFAEAELVCGASPNCTKP